ncbi:MAG: nucleotidyltransferase [Alcanivoracaceae bacterium]|nr:nucleotidyltransferase [Alcanivoracaceae bacterium]MDY6883884.1 nucleotidyltransferase [Pseudomonadota bacterium]|tara:strand:+ start:6396 stop:7694 length:1299 start_codon:yes stop_codon:yes gene_type:complete
MSVADMFKDFLNNLKVDNAEKVSLRYGEITKSLNQKFRDSESTTANTLQVGSYGRYTGIKGISDLDMLYIMPKSKWDTYRNGKQSQLLTDVKDAIKARYPKTDVRVDRLVVTVTYQNFHVEVQPVFEETDENDESYFQYPDSYNGGSWKVTKPRQEMKAVKDLNDEKNKNVRLLCKMIRAWRNKHGVVMGGLLIDTLAFNFMKSTTEFDDKGYIYFDWLSRDFFKYISELPDREHYKAPGSNQNVKVKKKFQKRAKEAYELCLAAIKAEGNSNANDKWKKVYGRNFPSAKAVEESIEKASTTWRNTEEFIEDQHPVDIRYSMRLDCDVSQNGFRENTLGYMLMKKIPLLANKKLLFRVVEYDVPGDFTLKWKVLNRGVEAQNRDQIRGQIVTDEGYRRRNESTTFRGEHFVECYAIKDGIVVARASIDVPIR